MTENNQDRQDMNQQDNAQIVHVDLPLTDDAIDALHCGDKVMLSGVLYTARDAAHGRIVDAIDKGEPTPFDLRGQLIYYCGPTPAKPGKVIGSCGPTTSGRMDSFTPKLLDMGLKGMLGKGPRSSEVIDAIKRNHAVYFSAVGGAAALIAKSIRKADVIAYDDLGPESVKRMVVENMPCIVTVDSTGRNLYEEGPAKYRKQA